MAILVPAVDGVQRRSLDLVVNRESGANPERSSRCKSCGSQCPVVSKNILLLNRCAIADPIVCEKASRILLR
jgi:hypothetical protein